MPPVKIERVHMAIAREEAWGFCQRKTCKINREMVWTDEEYPYENFLSQNRRQIIGKCIICGNTLCRFASKIEVMNPILEPTEQQELEDNLADSWRSYSRQGRSCPRCGGYMRGAVGNGQEIDNDCLNCGYAGPVVRPTEDIHIRNVERFSSPKRNLRRA